MTQRNVQKTLNNVKGQVFPSYKSIHKHVDVQEPNGQIVKYEPDQALMLPQLYFDNVYQLQTTVPSNFFMGGGGSPIDIQIPIGDFLIEDILLEVGVSETGGSSSITPTNAPLMFSQIQTLVNSGSDISQTIYDVDIWHNLNFLTNEQVTNIVNVNNMNTSFAGPSSIAASGSATYFVPLIGNIFQTGHGIFMGGLKGYIVMRFYGNSSVESGSGTLALNKLVIHAKCKQLPQYQMDELRKEYETSVLEKPYIDYAHMPLPNTYNASTQYTIQMSGLTGSMAYALIGLRSSTAATSGGIRTFANLGNLAQVAWADENGNLVNSPTYEYYAIQRFIDSARWFPGTFFSSIPMIPIVFGDPYKAVMLGESRGSYYCNSRDQLQFTPNSSWSNGTYTLDVYGVMVRHMHINKERFEVFKA